MLGLARDDIIRSLCSVSHSRLGAAAAYYRQGRELIGESTS